MISIIHNQPAFNFINTLVSKFRIAGDSFLSKKEFVFQNKRKDKKQAAPLITINDILAESAPTQKLATGFTGAFNEHNNHEEFLKDYVHGLEEMMFMTHHKVRQPVANILGMVTLIDEYANSPDELKKIVDYMKQSALDLDAFTRELTTFVSNLEQKGKNKGK